MDQTNREPQKQEGADEPADTTPPIHTADTRESEQGASKATHQREESTYQQQITRWNRFTKWTAQITVAEAGMVLLTLVIAGSSVLYTIFARRQWTVMDGQLTEMHDEQRAWIKDESPILLSPLIVDNNALAVTLEYRLNNVGHRPAYNADFSAAAVLVWLKAKPSQLTYNAAPNEEIAGAMNWPNIPTGASSAFVARKVCDILFEKQGLERATLTSTFLFSGTSIFPNDEAVDSYKIYEREQSLKSRPPDSGSYIVGMTSCIQYQSADESTVHHEQSVYSIDGFDPSHSDQRFSLNPNGRAIPT